MQTSNKKLPIIFVLPLFLVYGCNGDGNKKGPPIAGYSSSVDISKANEVFQFEAAADRDVFLLDSGLRCKIKNAWVENAWQHQHYIFGKDPIQKINGSYQLLMNLKIDSVKGRASRYFYFIGNKSLNNLIYYNCNNYYSHRIDSIKVPLYRESSPMLSSRKDRKAFDTLVFVKRTVGS